MFYICILFPNPAYKFILSYDNQNFTPIEANQKFYP